MEKLLIAVRSKALAATVAQALTQYEVHTCHTGPDALRLLETLTPEVFLVELTLPEVSGLSVLEATQYRPPVILALTCLVSEALLEKAAAAGVREVLLLPCPAASIIQRLKKHPLRMDVPERST